MHSGRWKLQIDHKTTLGYIEFFSGVKAEIPILLGVIPFGLIYGVLALSVGLPAILAQATSSVIFAGSSQFIMAQLVGVGAPGMVIVATVLVVNLRHALYSVSVAPYIRHLAPLWKMVLAYLLTDEAYAVAITHYQQQPTLPQVGNLREAAYKHWYFLGVGLTLWSGWQVSTAVGIFLGAQMPASWSLDFTLTLTFIGLVMPALKDKAGMAAALIAGIVAVLAFGLPFKLGLLVAAAAGIVAGILVEWKQA